MSGAPAGYEEVAPPPSNPHLAASGPPPGYEEVPPPIPESPSLWQKANTGLVSGSSILNAVGHIVPKPPDMLPGETVSQYLERGKTALDPDHPIMAGIRAGLSGTASDLANTISSFTSPVSLALAGTGVAARALPATGKAAMAAKIALRGTEAGAGAAFGVQGAKQAAQADWTSPEGIAQGLQGAGQAALGTAGVLDVAKAPFRQYIGLKSKAANSFQGLDSTIGDTPVNHQPVMRAIEKVNDLGKKGFTVPKVMNDFENWVTERQSTRVVPGPNGELIDTPGSLTPLNWRDARDFYSAMNEAIDWKEVQGDKMQRAIKGVRSALDSELRSVANSNDMGAQYASALKDYSKAMQVQSLGWGVGKIAGRALGYMSPVHPWATGHVGAQVGGPVVGGMVNSVLNASPEQYTRTILEAKEGKISPGEADRRISKMGGRVKVSPLPERP